MVIREHSIVVLTRDLPAAGLRKGGIGTVVHAYDDRTAEVEFLSGAGETVAVVTVTSDSLRAADPQELIGARQP
jgi:hypothetical protein